jgi:predicted DNA-binding antitoxin AbrB/MazE fold protein
VVAIMGTYENGVIKLNEKIKSETPLKVVVTFLEEFKAKEEHNPPKRLRLEDFHFAESRAALKDIKGSLSESLIEERRSYL